MRQVSTVSAIAVLAAAAATPMPLHAQGATVEAGGQQCIAWQFVRDVRGIYDSSYINFTNRCPRPVTFFLCQAQVFINEGRPPCDAMIGQYSFMTAPPGWQSRSSMSARGQVVVVIRECPTGYRPSAKTSGHFFCGR